ncbi:hypothetical protein B0H11DRAFT_2254179 [Mycena galericulata]|nr:hypothetical protein B0H11DRAFT_2254179 [Mycena galericulata]
MRSFQSFPLLFVFAISGQGLIVARQDSASESCVLTSKMLTGIPSNTPYSVTLPLEPSPTLTNTAVASAYSVYVEQCGTNLDAIAYSALSVYTNEGNADTTILDPAFVQWVNNNDGDWSQGQADCSSASSALDNAATGTAAGPAGTSTPATTSAPSTGKPSSQSSANHAASQGQSSSNKPASTSSTGAQATPTTGGAARAHHQGCSFILAVAAVILGQMVWS